MPAPRGKFIWYDVMTSDTKAAAKFYSDVIGWDAQEHPMADGSTYTIFSKGPAMVAGLMATPEAMRAEGAPLDRELAFYSRLFGWTKDRVHDMGPMGAYQTFATGCAPCGGVTKACAQVPHPCWNYYIAVDDVAKAADRAAARGGQVLQGPMEVPGGAWIVQARDPEGAHFAMVSAPK
jgi:hypothetical protein